MLIVTRSGNSQQRLNPLSTSCNWLKHAEIKDREKRLPARHKHDNAYKIKDNIHHPRTQ
jgi:hypothetical protein